jgi:hypothetical protein
MSYPFEFSTAPFKIFLSPCDQGPDAWDHQTKLLRRLHANSSKTLHQLVDSPEQADFILISNLRDEDGHRSVWDHPLRRRFPAKCFGITDTDYPFPILRGLYTSARSSALHFGRIRGGSYALYHDETRNPFLTSPPADPPPQKVWLFSFVGSNNHPVRDTILRTFTSCQQWLVEESTGFNVFAQPDQPPDAGGRDRQRHFANVLGQSKFSLCPRGRGRSTVRLFESMQAGVAPVILSDQWLPPDGPDWPFCSIQVRERDAPHLATILAERESEWQTLGQAAGRAFQTYFADEVYFNYIVSVLDSIHRTKTPPEALSLILPKAQLAYHRARDHLKSKLPLLPPESPPL